MRAKSGVRPSILHLYIKNLTTKIINFYKAFSLFSPREQIQGKILFQFQIQVYLFPFSIA